MTRKICFTLLLFAFLANTGRAAQLVSTDSISTILRQKNGADKDRNLISAFREYFQSHELHDLPVAKKSLDSLLAAFPMPDAEAFGLLAENMYYIRQNRFTDAERALVRSISLTQHSDDRYLFYDCLTQLAVLQSIMGNNTEALSTFRRARQEAITLDDPYLLVQVNINISDIYHSNKLYQQSLLYIDQAMELMRRRQFHEPELYMILLVNKVENYFSMVSVDSLAKYNSLLINYKFKSDELYSYQQRSTYMLYIAQGHYSKALQMLANLKKEPLYAYDESDDKYLANALFNNGQVDSARIVAQQLIANPVLQNHPEETLPLYEMLGRIALINHQKDTTIRRFDEALQQAKTQITRLVAVDTIAARLKLDDMQSSYISREGGFKRERLWLIFGVVTVSLILVVGAMMYRNNQQKRKFERLLFESKRSELSFINSHETRRHLSNILGIIETISHADDRHQEYLESESHLLSAANDLDRSIREIADKLSDDINT